jgi:S-phase kinase-associated protein 1
MADADMSGADKANSGDPVNVTLVSSQGDSFQVEGKVAMMSNLVKTMIGGLEDEGGSSNGSAGSRSQEIPLPNVKTEVLVKVIEYCRHHVDMPVTPIQKPLVDSDMSKVVPLWDANFVDLEQETLFELILAANYMDIKPLLDLTCAKVASMIKGKTPEEIRKAFNIVNDFSPEEEQKVREENKWCEES